MRTAYGADVSFYAPFDLRIVTPRLELCAATDDVLEQLAPLVRSGEAMADPPPWDDPSSFYEADPDVRVRKWLQGVWRGRGTVRPEARRRDDIEMSGVDECRAMLT